MISVAEIAEQLNAQAASLAPDLLPNGRRAGTRWMFSGIADSGRSESAWVNLSGAKIGKWFDMGNAAPGEERGDMLDLLRLRLGLRDAAAAVEEAKRRLGIADDFRPGQAKPDPALMAQRAEEARQRAEARAAEDAKDREAKAKRAKAMWLGGKPIGGTPAERYLRGRGLSDGGEWPGALRFCPDVWCTDTRDKHPAMLAAIYTAEGRHVGTHRTFLACQGGRWTKMPIEAPKKVYGSMWGGFIPIAKGASGKSMAAMPEREPVYVTEGIEDALVARMMKPEARIVSAISLGNMGAIVLPAAARRLILVCDRDTKEKAQEQLARSIGQQQARGVSVELVLPPIEVGGRPVKDLNDWLNALQMVDRANVRPAASMPPVSEQRGAA